MDTKKRALRCIAMRLYLAHVVIPNPGKEIFESLW